MKEEPKPRKSAWVLPWRVELLPPAPRVEHNATAYHGPTGDVTDPEAQRLVERVRRMTHGNR